MKNGFTLIEILVALGVFVLISAIVFNVFNTGSRIKNKIFASQNVRSELQYALEFMGREIRMLRDIDETQEAGVSDSEIELKNSNCDDVDYCLADSNGTCNPGGEYIARNGEVFTSSDIKIESLIFSVNNFNICDGALPAAGNSVQPSVTLIIKASSRGIKYVQTPIEVQTTISSRFYPYSEDYCAGNLPCP